MNTATQYISAAVDPAEIEKRKRPVRRQTDGVGLRMGKTSEFTLVAPVKEGGAEVFRQRIVQAQAESSYWEGKLGTVHDLRVALINNDTQIMFAATYSDEFKPYVEDVTKFASPWLDCMFSGVAEGYTNFGDPAMLDYVAKYQVEADLWFVENESATPREIKRALKLSEAFNTMLDSAQS
jgi:hypothetical protein